MARHLFELALSQLKPADWEVFERLASQFLVIDFPNLRTMASPSGDGGRDSELFCPDGDPTVCLQYSVSTDWATKIRKTHNRLKESFPDVKLLVYATNQPLGAKADDIKSYLQGEGRFIDIRDQTWFLERQDTHTARAAAAAEIIDKIAAPYIKEYEKRKFVTSPLKTIEARTALTYICLQLHDDQHGKGLTKVCFDALVRAALRDSTNEKHVPRKEIHATVLKALASADDATISPLVDASLDRLKKRVITHHTKTDSFFLRHEEGVRIQSRITETAVLEAKLKSILGVLCIEYLSEAGPANPHDVADLQARIPRIIETLCLCSGEQFVTAVTSSQPDALEPAELNTIIFNDLNAHTYKSPGVAKYPELIQHVIRALAVSENPVTRAYLRSLSTSYTLMAFLNQTPDVQKATKKIFSHGKIWLDTSVILPLFAEQLLEADQPRIYKAIFEACVAEGDELFIIPGVLDEINHHMQNCLQCVSKMSEWRGVLPYLLSNYLKTGRSLHEVRAWLDEFRGAEDPKADIEIYLKEEHGITVSDLTQASKKVDEEVRHAVERIWSEAHEARRANTDAGASQLLKNNDVEMYVGVMGLRREKNTTPELGPRNWLLTKDKTARLIGPMLRKEFPDRDVRPPLLSLAFLINAIEFCPSRAGLTQEIELRLPTILDVELEETDSAALMEIAEKARNENSGFPERVIRRKVRESIDGARRRRWNADKALESSDYPRSIRSR